MQSVGFIRFSLDNDTYAAPNVVHSIAAFTTALYAAMSLQSYLLPVLALLLSYTHAPAANTPSAHPL